MNLVDALGGQNLKILVIFKNVGKNKKKKNKENLEILSIIGF